MIREVEWREDRDIRYSIVDDIEGVRVKWHVLWFGETAEESGGKTYRTRGESLDKVAELLGDRDNWRMESGANRHTWTKLRP